MPLRHISMAARLLAIGQVGARLSVDHAHLRARHGQAHRAAHVLALAQPPARQHRRRLCQAPAVLRARTAARQGTTPLPHKLAPPTQPDISSAPSGAKPPLPASG